MTNYILNRLFLLLFAINTQEICCVYFTQTNYTVTLSPEVKPGSLLLDLFCYGDSTFGHSAVTDFHTVAVMQNTQLTNKTLFDELFIPSLNRLSIYSGNVHYKEKDVYKLLVNCTDRSSIASSMVTVLMNQEKCQQKSYMIASSSFVINERVSNVTIGKLPCVLCQPYYNCSLIVTGLAQHSYSDHFILDEATLYVRILHSVDHEIDSLLQVLLTCRQLDVQETFCVTNITVKDVNDEGPYISLKHVRLMRYDMLVNHITQGESTNYAVYDADDCSTNNYSVTITNDVMNIFSVKTFGDIVAGTGGCYYYIDCIAHRNIHDIPKPYIFQIVFLDLTFIQYGSTSSAKAFYNITIDMDEWEPDDLVYLNLSTSISSMSTRYTQVYSFAKKLTKDYRYYFDGAKEIRNEETFKITPREGIVYLNKPQGIAGNASKNYLLQIIASNGSRPLLVSTLLITVKEVDSPSPYTNTNEENACVTYNTEEQCLQEIGIGSPSGYCTWRRTWMRTQSTDMEINQYETCSPSLSTCPNLVCDELEDSVSALCPQDCIDKRPIGMAHLNDKFSPPRGIIRGESPCWCTKNLNNCYCMRNFTFNINNDGLDESRNNTKSVKDLRDYCDEQCFVITISCLAFSLVIVIMVAVSCWWYYVRIKKHVARSAGMSSEYAFFTRGTVEYTAQSSSPDSMTDEIQQRFVTTIEIDSKWEVNRHSIKLDSAIGEGEFGRVAKATVEKIGDSEGITTVAIKMLKENATHAEYRDLLSEFNLLKEVNHRNVVKLLGVCSRNGPFFLIVEYCEYGSLRSLLRRSRWKYGFPHEESHSPNQSSLDLAVQDLLSFAWQVANGMAYLSELKVVHRDLAARNILVANGMIAKISDFGLSRDIYEDDAYLKTTKGPLPVKWMAPESLFDQVYTTKSDSWSFGVVLWEIVTLAANPYPGIAAEHLCHLLKTGYRMDKPNTCSDELYAVMTKCWNINPADRPSFKQLTVIFESFLTKESDAVYLDLLAVTDERISGTVEAATSWQYKKATGLDSHYKQPRSSQLVLSQHDHLHAVYDVTTATTNVSVSTAASLTDESLRLLSQPTV